MTEDIRRLIQKEVARAVVKRGLDPLLTPEETAERLRISVRTLARWRLEGGGPRYAKLGGSVRYRSSSVDAWVEEREVGCTSELNSV